VASIKVTQRPTQSVEFPDRERVALRKSLEAQGQLRPLDVRPGCLVGEDALAPRPQEGGKLQVGILIVGRYPRIAYFHGPLLSLIYGMAKPLIYQRRESVSKILIFGTGASPANAEPGTPRAPAARGKKARTRSPSVAWVLGSRRALGPDLRPRPALPLPLLAFGVRVSEIGRFLPRRTASRQRALGVYQDRQQRSLKQTQPACDYFSGMSLIPKVARPCELGLGWTG
jgi:hypothetical protein